MLQVLIRKTYHNGCMTCMASDGALHHTCTVKIRKAHHNACITCMASDVLLLYWV